MDLSKPAQEALYALAAGPLSHAGLCASLAHRHPDTVRNAHRELERAEPALITRRGTARAVIYEITTQGREALSTQGEEQGPRVTTQGRAPQGPRVETQGDERPAPARHELAKSKSSNKKKCGSGSKRASPTQGRTHGHHPGWEAIAELTALVRELRAENAELRGRVSPGKEATCSESSRAAPAAGPIVHRDLKPANAVIEPAEAIPTPASPSGGERPSDLSTPTESVASRPAHPSSPIAPASSASPAAGERRPTEADVEEAVEFRIEQERPKGFRKSEAALRKDLRRKFRGDRWTEVREILDEKRELAATKGRPAPPPESAVPVESPQDYERRMARVREEVARAEAGTARQKILENAAARRAPA